MDRTNLVMISTDDIGELDEMFGTEQDRLNMYNEMLSCIEEEPLSKWEYKVDDYAREVATEYYNDFLTEWGDLEVLCIADFGLWDGRHDGGIHGKLSDILGKCVQDYNTLWYDKEHHTFLMKAIHHDGTNWYTFHALSKRGIEYLARCGDYRDTHQHVINTKGYTKQIKY